MKNAFGFVVGGLVALAGIVIGNGIATNAMKPKETK